MPSESKPTLLTGRFNDALCYAADLHRHQVRKGDVKVPYVGHLLGVASIVIEEGADEDTAIAALLHDAVEDQGGHGRLEDIRRRFGDRVASIVAECTDAYEERKPAWKKRKEAYVAHLAVATPEARLVSAADKLYNARSILRDHRRVGARVWERFSASRDEIRWYYQAVVEKLRASGDHPRLVDELARTVAELVELD